jgi:hypothetical protein
MRRSLRKYGRKYISKTYCKKEPRRNKYENSTKFITDKVLLENLRGGVEEYTANS